MQIRLKALLIVEFTTITTALMDEDYDTYIFNEELSKECSLSQQTVSEKKCLYTRTHHDR